ncbi:glycerate kinase [uncultured Lentibacter sp.]|uniref:glycerate kinase type-2 family protein n=1 Tax=uncultured Lentibacter sp. TaxID=1659309 RepID=UPI002629D7BA|nr:glycerate kinase [uncultured Lentibacter sp.]
MEPRAKALLTSLFDTAITAADPLQALANHLPQPPTRGRTVVIGAGKGAAQMAAALEQLWPTPLSGCVVTRYGFGAPTRQIKVLQAAHPVPDAAGLAATTALFDQIKDLTPHDLVIALVCGGGSALLAAPAAGLTLKDEQTLNEALLACGAPISAMNAIRKMFSRVKGGRLAAATQARMVSLVVSDVPRDDPAEVASGPTVPSWSNRATARAALEQHKITLPAHLLHHLQTAPEPPVPSDPVFANHEVHVIASAAQSLAAAARVGAARGWPVEILGDDLEGEARRLGAAHAAYAKASMAPRLILSGGETTVTLTGQGRGGRNSEYLLAFALGIDGAPQINALAADTDGIDGSEDNAGAFATGQTAALIRAAGTDPLKALADNDAYTAFAAAQALFTPGPTGTNVNDFRAILIGWPP